MFRTRLISFLIWISPAFDFLKGPAVFTFFWRLLVKARPLTEEEITTVSSVLGSETVRYRAVRLAGGRLLEAVFKRNASRAFTTFYTINFPKDQGLDILVHELSHVRQFERVGAKYLLQALKAQFELEDAYQYGGLVELAAAHRQNKKFLEFNREQQA